MRPYGTIDLGNSDDRFGVGYTRVVVELGGMVANALVYLVTGPMYQYQFDAEYMEEREVMNDVGEVDVVERFTCQQNDKGLTSMGADVGGGSSEPPCIIGGGHGQDTQ